MSRVSRLLALGVVVYATTVLFAACGGKSETPAESLLPPSAQTAPVRALMAAVIDPAADVVWESVATIMTGPNEIEERVPKTDEEWANVRRNALVIMEASDLLTTPGRPIAGPGEKSIVPGVELEPSEIAANVAKDQEKWNQHARGLREATAAMLRAIDAKDRNAMFDLGEGLDTACENCHTTFWYPGQILPPGYN
jgi:hypothetical protein